MSFCVDNGETSKVHRNQYRYNSWKYVKFDLTISQIHMMEHQFVTKENFSGRNIYQSDFDNNSKADRFQFVLENIFQRQTDRARENE